MSRTFWQHGVVGTIVLALTPLGRGVSAAWSLYSTPIRWGFCFLFGHSTYPRCIFCGRDAGREP